MGQLTLIRHGQAAAFSEDSDRLTELGARQALALADHFIEHGIGFDVVITGSLVRQLQTEQIIADRHRERSVAWPTAARDPGWNEYDAGGISQGLSEALVARDPHFAKLADDFRRHAQGPERNRYFQRMFEQLMDEWVSGAEASGVESFAQFHARVGEARARILSAPSARPGGAAPPTGGQRVAVFSSGGPIGVCVQLALQAPPAQALRVNWRVRNASLTEFVFSRDRLSLDTFNTCPHLLDPALQSFR